MDAKAVERVDSRCSRVAEVRLIMGEGDAVVLGCGIDACVGIGWPRGFTVLGPRIGRAAFGACAGPVVVALEGPSSGSEGRNRLERPSTNMKRFCCARRARSRP